MGFQYIRILNREKVAKNSAFAACKKFYELWNGTFSSTEFSYQYLLFSDVFSLFIVFSFLFTIFFCLFKNSISWTLKRVHLWTWRVLISFHVPSSKINIKRQIIVIFFPRLLIIKLIEHNIVLLSDYNMFHLIANIDYSHKGINKCKSMMIHYFGGYVFSGVPSGFTIWIQVFNNFILNQNWFYYTFMFTGT